MILIIINSYKDLKMPDNHSNKILQSAYMGFLNAPFLSGKTLAAAEEISFPDTMTGQSDLSSKKGLSLANKMNKKKSVSRINK